MGLIWIWRNFIFRLKEGIFINGRAQQSKNLVYLLKFFSMKNFILLLSFTIILCIGCNSTKTTTEGSAHTSPDPYKIENPDPNLTLTQHLRRISSVRVSGNGSNATVRIRGASCPIFLVDGHRLRGGLSAVDMIPVQDIESIRVLKPAEANLFYRGLDGPRGVIAIKTR